MATEQYAKNTTVVREQHTPIGEARIVEDKTVIGSSYSWVYYILNVVEGILMLRLLFKLFGANPAAGFTNFLYSLTDPLVRPFAGVFSTSAAGVSVFEWSTIIAMIVYALVAYGIMQLFTMLKSRSTTL